MTAPLRLIAPMKLQTKIPLFKTPKAPKYSARSSAAKTGRLPRLASIPQTLKYPKITKKNPLKISTEEKLVGGGAALVGARTAKALSIRAAKAAAETIITPARLAAATGGQIGAQIIAPALIAGVAAYYITRAIINYRARTKEERAQNAFELSKAYRLARSNIETKQRRNLTPAQHQTLGNVFKSQLADLGLSTRDLSRL
ncbi:MAG: hypothetical protein ACREJC_22400 [Tepidisphaeraceae bacterium]